MTLENLPFEHKQTFAKTQLKIFTIFFKNKILFAHLDKAIIKTSCCEISHQKLFYLRDMDDYNQTDQCAKKVRSIKYIIIPLQAGQNKEHSM